MQDGTKKMCLESAGCGRVVAAAHWRRIDYEADILRVIDSTLLVGHFLVQAPGTKTLVGNGLWHGALQRLQLVVKLGALSSSRAAKHNPSRRLHSAVQHKAWQGGVTQPPLPVFIGFHVEHDGVWLRRKPQRDTLQHVKRRLMSRKLNKETMTKKTQKKNTRFKRLAHKLTQERKFPSAQFGLSQSVFLKAASAHGHSAEIAIKLTPKVHFHQRRGQRVIEFPPRRASQKQNYNISASAMYKRGFTGSCRQKQPADQIRSNQGGGPPQQIAFGARRIKWVCNPRKNILVGRDRRSGAAAGLD